MSHPMYHDDEDTEIILKPKPRRPFELSSPPPSEPTTPTESHQSLPPYLQTPMVASMDGSTTPSRTRSFLNLTSSTLFGIYEPTGYKTERDETTTPWGTGAQTPAEQSPVSRQTSYDWAKANVPERTLHNGRNGHQTRRRSTVAQQQRAHHLSRRGPRGHILPLIARIVTLFGIGVLYAVLITHLHDQQRLAPVKVELDRSSWIYLACWGLGGVILGQALPWLDTFWAPEEDEDEQQKPDQSQKSVRGLDGWMEVVRSIGAFVGIAFAIRRLPWESTLQMSLTLALANPAIWYIVDRTPPGFILSAISSLAGTAVLLGLNPALLPPSTPGQASRGKFSNMNGSANASSGPDGVLGGFGQESVGIATWIASVFFVSAVCFGNIGRRLALQKP